MTGFFLFGLHVFFWFACDGPIIIIGG